LGKNVKHLTTLKGLILLTPRAFIPVNTGVTVGKKKGDHLLP
jgi:hypothetical protein